MFTLLIRTGFTGERCLVSMPFVYIPFAMTVVAKFYHDGKDDCWKDIIECNINLHVVDIEVLI